jgi:two-component system, sensor histidine kinase and response regulator
MSKAQVLVIDDEIDNLNALRRLLRSHFEVFTANNGQEALDLVQKNRNFDVLVSDQRMPGMTGSEFFEKVQAFSPKTTRILLTGFADLEAVIEAVNKGHIWRYVSKPWEPEELIQTLHQAAERTKMSRSLERSKKELEKALNELRAKDWARERLLLILLHEFRTAPQIVENLKTLNEDKNPEDHMLRQQFLDNLQKRFAIMAEDIQLLLDDEKRFAALEKSPVSLLSLLEELRMKRGLTFSSHLEAGSAADVFSNIQMLREALEHFMKVISGNSKGVRPSATLEELGGQYFVSFRLETESPPLLPKGLEKAALHADLAWTALLEPFVGIEAIEHHSTGLRVETARWVRFLNSQGFRPEFQISGNGSVVELLISFKPSS